MSKKEEIFLIHGSANNNIKQQLIRHFTVNEFTLHSEAQQANGLTVPLTHLAILKQAEREQRPYIVIAEPGLQILDDEFGPKMQKMLKWCRENMGSWGVFNFGPNTVDGVSKVISGDPLVVQYAKGHSTKLCVYNSSVYQKILGTEKIYQNCQESGNFNEQLLGYDKIIGQLGLKLVTTCPFLVCEGSPNGIMSSLQSIQKIVDFVRGTQPVPLNPLDKSS